MQEQIEAVQRMQDFIDAHLYEDIKMADLAKAACYSPWHSYRLFIRWTNLTPSDYIRRHRLSKSALKLRDEKVKVADIAFELDSAVLTDISGLFSGNLMQSPGVRRTSGSDLPVHPLWRKISDRQKEEDNGKRKTCIYSACRQAGKRSHHKTWCQCEGLLCILR